MVDSGARRSLPRGPGTYALLLYLAGEATLPVGRRRSAFFQRGYYLYVGSALGGLAARLSRHLGRPERLHWHIDYLLRAATLEEIWVVEGNARLECVWAERLARADAVQPTPFAFGATDCRCRTHLFFSARRPQPDLLDQPGLEVIPLPMS